VVGLGFAKRRSRFVIEKLTERNDDSVGGLCFHTIEQDLLPVERRKIRSVVEEIILGQVQLPLPPAYLEITELFVA
jgi:hypothetical protein